MPMFLRGEDALAHIDHLADGQKVVFPAIVEQARGQIVKQGQEFIHA